ncbi:hypothetical protein CJ010_04470 [Azoarcus sp. DD4]|uniref:hypothetical protein n=1 Tax=Azoarcus sp. DD4 TaxID=2027405 RepID=UPI001126AE4F|nr:hypothetical protein [Azoarcus sp. DD4]QDF95854.1 hypothetical protein CJ010_04470 [Azoarcus sp. DD4]
MKTQKVKALIATLLCGGLLIGGNVANAHGDRYDDDRRHWRHPGKGWGHHKHHFHGPDTVVRERVIIRERPRYYDRDVYYDARPAYRAYRHDPAVVIGVQIPPLVIPLR